MPPLQVSIVRYFFTKFCVVSNPDHAQNGIGFVNDPIESSLDVQQTEKGGNIYIAQQRIKLDATNNPSLPYSLDVECIGIFKVEPALEEKQRVPMIMTLAHNVLYPSIREAVLIATGRQPWGPLSIGVSILQGSSEETVTEKKSKVMTTRKKRDPKTTKLTK